MRMLVSAIFYFSSAVLVGAVRILPSSRRLSVHNNHTHESSQEQQQQRRTQSIYVEPPKSPDDHLVGILPLQKQPFRTQHWAGHLPASANAGDKYLFYWLFAPEITADTIKEEDAPVLIWLNGGPACSSMDGLFIENGPLRLTKGADGAFELTFAPDSWHRAPAYTLYIDQPVGTGLSFTTSKMYPRNDQEVNVDLYYFLQEFFRLHSDKFVTNGVMHRNLFFSGESYAGHYIPSIMNYIMKQKDTATENGQISIPVRGAAIGNGWMDPFYQYAGAEFAYGHGLVGMSHRAAFAEAEKKCQAQLNQKNYNVVVCFDLIDDIINQSHGAGASTKASGYDIRKSELKHSERDFPPGHKVVETYLGGHRLPVTETGKMSTAVWEDVLKSIHATAATEARQTYKECTDPPYNALSGNDGLGVVDDVVELLQHPDNVQLLFFNGIYDIICNHVGNEKFLEEMPWEHSGEWFLAERYAWFAKSDETNVAGYMKEFRNLQYLKVLDAGHMVPMDVPNVAFDMIQTFMEGGSFKKYKQDMDVAKEHDTCPVCPTCYERDSAVFAPVPKEPSSIQSRSGDSGDSSKYIWHLAGIAIGSFLTAIYFRKGNNGSSRLPTDEMELQELQLDQAEGSYKDEPNGYSSQSRVV